MRGAVASDGVGWPLADWLLRHGGSLGPLQLRSGAAGRGVFATGELCAGAAVLCVPAVCLIGVRTAGLVPAARFICDTWSGLVRSHILLAAFLAHAHRVGDRHFAPYLATLPTAMPQHPLFFSPPEIKLLRGTGFLSLVTARRERLTEEWELLQRAAPGLSDLGCREWWLARSLVTSRAFARETGRAPTLVPLADLLNHSLTPGVDWDFGPQSADFAMHATQTIVAGSELHDSYGRKSNGRLLLHYGFVLPDNPIEECVLDLGDGTSQVLPNDPDDPALAAMPGLVDRDRLAALCAAQLARLAPADELGPDSDNARHAVLIRETERRILTRWVDRARRASSDIGSATMA